MFSETPAKDHNVIRDKQIVRTVKIFIFWCFVFIDHSFFTLFFVTDSFSTTSWTTKLLKVLSTSTEGKNRLPANQTIKGVREVKVKQKTLHSKVVIELLNSV